MPTASEALAAFDRWYHKDGHWVYSTRERALAAWRSPGIDGLPDMPPIADLAREAIALWEADPKRQALVKILRLEPGQVTDDMIRRVSSGASYNRGPNLQQIPREKRKP